MNFWSAYPALLTFDHCVYREFRRLEEEGVVAEPFGPRVIFEVAAWVMRNSNVTGEFFSHVQRDGRWFRRFVRAYLVKVRTVGLPLYAYKFQQEAMFNN